MQEMQTKDAHDTQDCKECSYFFQKFHIVGTIFLEKAM